MKKTDTDNNGLAACKTTLPGKIDYKADEEIKMPSICPKICI